MRAFVLVMLLLVAGCGSKRIGYDPVDRSDAGFRVVRTAQTQIGKRYRAGGTSPATGFDCSGLIWWAFRQHGVSVPRVTRDQASAGSGVSRSNLRPGDILVFKTRSGPAGLHTALYAGNGAFVHSPSSGKRIRMNGMNEEYWRQRLIGVRRVLR